MALPNTVSWVLKKIWGYREVLVINLVCKKVFFDNSGYLIKKMYQVFLSRFPKVQWRRVLCNNFVSPESLFILCLAVHGRLPTKDRLQHWGIATTGLCSLCGTELEYVQHFFKM